MKSTRYYPFISNTVIPTNKSINIRRNNDMSSQNSGTDKSIALNPKENRSEIMTYKSDLVKDRSSLTKMSIAKRIPRKWLYCLFLFKTFDKLWVIAFLSAIYSWFYGTLTLQPLLLLQTDRLLRLTSSWSLPRCQVRSRQNLDWHRKPPHMCCTYNFM